MLLGIPAAVAAALAGSAILSSGSGSEILFVSTSTVGGILALVAAAFSATLTTVNASRRTNQAQSSANAYIQLQTEARQFVTVDLVTLDFAEARQGLESITTSRNELNKTSEAPGKTA